VTRPPALRTLEAAKREARLALAECDDAAGWLARSDTGTASPLAAEVWVFDSSLSHVLLVRHRLRGWVPPGGKVELGETPRGAARRELVEDGVRAELLERPALVTVRSYHPNWPATMGVSFMAVVDRWVELVPEDGQPAAWKGLDEPWKGWFSDDRLRMRQRAEWLSEVR
jgi:8-oxo-dGTP diphosphatase